MWRVTAFVPAAALLLLLASAMLRQSTELRQKRAVYPTIALALLAWLSIVLPLYLQPASTEAQSFVAQRDLGYFVGSALFLLAPFAAVSALSHLIRRLGLGKLASAASAVALVTVAALFLPGLFSAGWIVGCAFAGYPSCM